MKTYVQEIMGEWYAFEGDMERAQVYAIGADRPKSGNWRARWTYGGIRYVASPSPSKRAAVAKARRAVKKALENLDDAEYCGVCEI